MRWLVEQASGAKHGCHRIIDAAVLSPVNNYFQAGRVTEGKQLEASV